MEVYLRERDHKWSCNCEEGTINGEVTVWE